jgi:hypothetical protein
MMKKLSPSVAFGYPVGHSDFSQTTLALRDVREGRRPVEIRLGVGPINQGGVPARVLGHAACVAAALNLDVPMITANNAHTKIVIFSSAPKIGEVDLKANLKGLVALGLALRLNGIDLPIKLEIASEDKEIGDHLKIDLPAELTQWIELAGKNSTNSQDPSFYAREHASASMFGDIESERADLPLRITIGCVPEARFWAVRTHVREVALAAGMTVAPALAIILKACRIPWYNATSNEPYIAALIDPDNAANLLKLAANPMAGGNAGLTRESRAFATLAKKPESLSLINVVDEIDKGIIDLQSSKITLGARLHSKISKGLTS